jgi:tRNA(Arg) A34 adenosine deaminase TadA
MPKKRYSISAVVTDKRGRMLSSASNSYSKSHPLQKALAEKMGFPHKEYLHAEILALLRVKDISKAHSIYVSRFDNNGKEMLAKPCEICQYYINECGIKNVFYTGE